MLPPAPVATPNGPFKAAVAAVVAVLGYRGLELPGAPWVAAVSGVMAA